MCGANRSICSYSDLNLAYVAKFQYKTGYAKKKKQKKQKKHGRYGIPQHTFFTWYIFCTKELISLRILSSLHKATKSQIFTLY
jgi:hypothetical protein